MLSDKVNMTPNGFVADQLSPEQFKDCHELIFDSLFEIHSSDISGLEGYGRFNEDGTPEYESGRDFLTDTFAEDKEGYWYNWRRCSERRFCNGISLSSTTKRWRLEFLIARADVI